MHLFCFVLVNVRVICLILIPGLCLKFMLLGFHLTYAPGFTLLSFTLSVRDFQLKNITHTQIHIRFITASAAKRPTVRSMSNEFNSPQLRLFLLQRVQISRHKHVINVFWGWNPFYDVGAALSPQNRLKKRNYIHTRTKKKVQ